MAGLTIPALVEQWAGSTPEAPAFLAPGRRPLSYARLYELIGYTVACLRSLGIRPSDRVAVTLPDGPEMAAAFLGVASAAAFAPLNPALSESEFEYCMRDLPARALITWGGQSTAARVAARLSIPVTPLIPIPGEEAGRFRLAAAPQQSGGVEHPQPGADALMMYTSGTTARPKLVPLTHQNLCSGARNILGTLSLDAGDRFLNVMPLFHVHALVSGVLAPLAAGGSTVLSSGFHPPKFLDWVREFSPTWYSASPSIHQSILAQAKADPQALAGHSLRLIRSAAAPLPPALMEEMETIWGVPVIEFLGMTEAAQQIASNPLPPRRRKPGSVGLPAGTEVTILSEDGQSLPAGHAGEIAIRGENVTRGYEGNPEVNQKAFHLGWLRTGDEGRFDSDGYLFVVGRRKEIINRGGEKISPREVEELLLEHPSVEQAVVFSVPHAQLGEEVGAALVARKGARVDEAEIRRFAASRLAAFKTPRVIRIVDELPKGPAGKPQRIGLAETLGIGALDDARPSVASGSITPRDELELQLAGVWERTLELPRVGVTDNFFDLGGSSAMAASLFVAIEARFGQALPPATLFEAPTVELMARILRRQGWKPRWRSLVPIQPVGTRTPIFCVHAAQGNVLFYAGLARHLGIDQPLYALQSAGVNGGRPHTCVEEMATAYIDELLEVQPEGPYLLGGFCSGAYIALEMACQLRERGKRVDLLASFSTDGAWRTLHGVSAGPRYHWDILRKLGNRRRLEYALSRLRYRASRVRNRTLFAGSRACLALGKPLPRTLVAPHIEEINRRAARRYQPRRFDGALAYFQGCDEEFRNPKPFWGNLVSEIITVPIAGRGEAIFQEPHVRVLAERLTAWLQTGESKPC